MPTVVVTPPSGPAKPRKPTGPSAKAYANVLTDLRKPKPVGRPTAAQTAAIALTPPQPAPRSAPSQADPGQPIMLLPPPQAASSANLSSRDAWLQRRAIALDLTTARQLLMAGQSPDARHILDNAQTHIRLFPVDRISQQVAVAIRALDGGDRVQALQAIDRAIDAAS